MMKRSEGFFTKVKAAFVAVLLSGALFGAAPAMAGPVAGMGVATATAKLCGPVTVATGSWGLVCFAGGGVLSILAGLAPTP